MPVYNGRSIKTKIKTFGIKVYTNFCGLNVPNDDIECESFTVISINSLVLYDKNIICKYIWAVLLIKLKKNKWQIILMKMLFLKIRYYTCCITIELTQTKELILLKGTIVKNAWFSIIIFYLWIQTSRLYMQWLSWFDNVKSW